MYKLFYIIFSCISILTACESGPDEKALKQEAEINLIKEAFTKYKAAVLSQKGYDAVKCLNQKTIDYYDDILNKIKFANKEEISALSSVDQMQILAIRHIYPKETISTLTGLTLYASTVTEGLMKGDALKTINIGHVATKGNKAKGQMVTNGEKTSIYFDFSKEDNQWKIDISTTFIMTSMHLNNEAKKSKLSTIDYLLHILKLTEKEKVDIFEPLKI